MHFGIKKSDLIWQESQIRFFREQLVPDLKRTGITSLFILGDVFDTRNTLNVQSVNAVIDLFKDELSGLDIRIIVGNHDMYMTTSTDINSLKILELLPNVTVYEKPTELKIDGKSILMLPWVTDYSKFDEIVTGTYDYCFCHADIIGFDIGGRLSESGLMAKNLLDHFRYTWSGHYHKGCVRNYEDGRYIIYAGSPYELTRIDRDDPKGYHVLDFETGEHTFVENAISIRYTRHMYPDVDMAVVKGNVVDLEIPYEMSDETKKIYALVEKIEKLGPAYPVNINVMPPPDDSGDPELEQESLNIVTLFKNYMEKQDTPVDKSELFAEFMKLYNTYKEQ